MLDIARYSNQSAISLGCAAIGLNILPGIAGAASHIVSMTGGLGTPTIQYLRNRISCRFGNTAKKKEHSRPVWRRLSTFKCALSAASSCRSSPRPSLPWNSCDSFSRGDDIWMLAKIQVKKLLDLALNPKPKTLPLTIESHSRSPCRSFTRYL